MTAERYVWIALLLGSLALLGSARNEIGTLKAKLSLAESWMSAESISIKTSCGWINFRPKDFLRQQLREGTDGTSIESVGKERP